jgi:hypothetical protein
MTTTTANNTNTQIVLNYTKQWCNTTRASSTDSDTTTPECSICYKPIQKKLFICSSPCNKIFHPSCLEKHFEQTANAFYDENYDNNDEPVFRCCYCRRTTNINAYLLEVFADNLVSMQKSGCYSVEDALHNVCEDLKNNTDGDYNFDYEIYMLTDIRRVKKPKQSKRVVVGNKLKIKNKMPRMAIKQKMNRNR